MTSHALAPSLLPLNYSGRAGGTRGTGESPDCPLHHCSPCHQAVPAHGPDWVRRALGPDPVLCMCHGPKDRHREWAQAMQVDTVHGQVPALIPTFKCSPVPSWAESQPEVALPLTPCSQMGRQAQP